MHTYVRVAGAFCTAAILAALVFPAPAAAQEKVLTFRNASGRCAWVTLYGYNAGGMGGTLDAWHIIGGAARPTWVGPGASKNFRINTPRVRVRAEVRPTGACNGSGGNPDRSRTEEIRNVDVLQISLSPSLNLTRP
ncbi:MAG TPA: hypothetical protein VMB20_01175 [Candidatus Acidoferrum sp.]|nr:hypothetical protein [Candidatus Acidoferrum sp.]